MQNQVQLELHNIFSILLLETLYSLSISVYETNIKKYQKFMFNPKTANYQPNFPNTGFKNKKTDRAKTQFEDSFGDLAIWKMYVPAFQGLIEGLPSNTPTKNTTL